MTYSRKHMNTFCGKLYKYVKDGNHVLIVNAFMDNPFVCTLGSFNSRDPEGVQKTVSPAASR